MNELVAATLREIAGLPITPEIGVIILNLLANTEGLTVEQLHHAISLLREKVG